MSIVILLPLVVLILLFVARLASAPRDGHEIRPWQAEFLISVCVWGALLVAVTEGLGLLHAIDRLGLAVGWGAILIALLVWESKAGALQRGWARLKRMFSMESLNERVLFGVAIVVAMVLLAVALVAPANSIDTLQYHMPRVDHWAQNRSLQHFATIYDQQNTRPYWTELVVLNLRVLGGGDRPGNLIQWFGMLAAMIAASGITGLLGGRREAQWFAALFTLSIPMALLQVTVPKNDVLAAMWVLSVAYFVVLSLKRRLEAIELIALGLSVGLAMLTKGTALIFVATLMAWFSIVQVLSAGVKVVVRTGIVVLVACVFLNGLFWYRNFATYGGPFGSNLPIRFAEQPPATVVWDTVRTPTAAGGRSGTGDVRTACGGDCLPTLLLQGPSPDRLFDLGSLVQERAFKLARMLAMNFVSPFLAFNQPYFRILRLLPQAFPPAFLDMLEAVAWNNEMWAGNPVHLSLVLVSFGIAALRPFRKRIGPLGGLSLAAIGGYVLVSFSGCSDWPICLRYQLPFFFLGGPIVALALAKLGQRAVWVAAFGLALYALPYVVISNMRPVVGHTPWPTRIPSVFTVSPVQILFAQSPEDMDEYVDLAGKIKDAGCSRVGLALRPGEQEYTLWWLLNAPESGIRLEYVVASDATRKYLDPSYLRCAILCTDCSQVASLSDLPLAFDYGHIRLYMRPATLPTP